MATMTIRCKVTRIIYRNAENGFQVFAAEDSASGKRYTVEGQHYDVSEGAELAVEGEFADTPRGKRFKAVSWQEVFPTEAEGIEQYLASNLVQGIGKKLAKAIVRRFGTETFNIIRREPERLCEIHGIGKARALRIGEKLRTQEAVHSIMVFLGGHGISPAYAVKIYRKYGSASIRQLKENPYCLCDDITGIGFRIADRIAQRLGYGASDPRRLAAGIRYVMKRAQDSDGHCYLPAAELAERATAELSSPADGVEVAAGAVGEVISDLVARGDLISDGEGDGEGERIYLPMYYHSERGVAQSLKWMMRTPASLFDDTTDDDDDAPRLAEQQGVEYNAQQQEAIETACRQKVMVLTGGPGTGKTTVVCGIIRRLRQHYKAKHILLAAPTGRAAKRMTESTGCEAKTIHRLLEYGGEGFGRNEDNPLSGAVLIVDESSMIDLMLMHSLLKAMPSEMKLILVGDIDQLPSVGAGNVLRDIIDSGRVPVVRLTEVFRQAQQSLITMNAHRINGGTMPEVRNRRESDFFFFAAETDEEASLLVNDLVSRRLPDEGVFSASDIQVLTPLRQRSATGSDALNLVLQQSVNPHGQPVETTPRLRLGDRVMQTRNNYELQVFNGDVGTVTAYDAEKDLISVMYQGRIVHYTDAQADDLTLAYAVTIHKSQGSEYPCVIVPILPSAYTMLVRNLLYTAVTRAKRRCIIVGQWKAVGICVSNGTVRRRYTRLAERLRDG